MSKKIGKGLSDLLANIEDERIQTAPAEIIEGERIYNIEISKITANPNQPRKHFGEREQKELEESIRVHGILQPLILVKKGDGFMIVAGERRYRAAKSAGLYSIPAMVKQINEDMIREISLIENLQRENLNAIEEAEALKELIDLNKYTQEQLALRIGKARTSVTNTLRLLSLDEEIKNLVRQDRLSAGHARTLIAVQDSDARLDFAYRAADGNMSVRELENKVRVYLNPELAPKRMSGDQKARLSLEMRNLIDDMKRIFATKVKAVGNENKGRIYIDYYSKDDLERIFELVEKLKI